MNNRFDELAKTMAQSVTRRAALKRFGVGLGAFALAALGLENTAEAGKGGNKGGVGDPCKTYQDCQRGLRCPEGICCPPRGPYEICLVDEDCWDGLRCGFDPTLGFNHCW